VLSAKKIKQIRSKDNSSIFRNAALTYAVIDNDLKRDVCICVVTLDWTCWNKKDGNRHNINTVILTLEFN